MVQQKRGQLAIFMILGVLLLMALAIVFMVNKFAEETEAERTIEQTQESGFETAPLANLVDSCLLDVSQEGISLLLAQGGRIYKSQGGTVLDYGASREGHFYLHYDTKKISYNLVRPRFTTSQSFITIPEYPWPTYPQRGGQDKFYQRGAFGITTIPALTSNTGPHSFQTQLETFVANNLDECLDFSLFEEQGFKITLGEPQVTVGINENDVTIALNNEITALNEISQDTTKVSDFFARHQIRLGKVHSYTKRLIELDASDATFDIRSGLGDPSFVVSAERDMFNNDDVIIVTDTESNFEGAPMRYQFGRHNRNPALHYIEPPTTLFSSGEEMTNEKVVPGYPDTLQADDPDEDTIDLSSFSITASGRENPLPFVPEELEYHVMVTTDVPPDITQIETPDYTYNYDRQIITLTRS